MHHSFENKLYYQTQTLDIVLQIIKKNTLGKATGGSLNCEKILENGICTVTAGKNLFYSST